MDAQRSWNHGVEHRESLLRRVDVPLVARGTALALGVIVVVSLLVAGALTLLDSGSVSESMASFVTGAACFFGYLAAGLYVGSHTRAGRMLQISALVAVFFALALIATLADAIGGFWLGSLMPGDDLSGAANVHLGFWAVTWVSTPVAAFLASAVVPRQGETWGSARTSEPEDTQV